MKANYKNNNYPVFEDNQVLSSLHLNQIFNYLDEQQRLTHANLIGIGIVSGLEIRFNPAETPTTIHLSKGCGITSEGHLIMEPEDVSLVSYIEYSLPAGLIYSPFRDASGKQYPLWELFPEGEPNATQLTSSGNFLDDKAVLLFLELKQENLRNCSANNCDDLGAKVTATVRRLLISVNDLNKIIAQANRLPSDSTTADLEQTLQAQLNLPDLRLPRYNVPNTNPVTTNDVLAAFHAIFSSDKLVFNAGNALQAAYAAFRPLLQKSYPADPFVDFTTKFGFLDSAPRDAEQIRFLQYYYDFFDDLLKGYEEFRQCGVKLLCACCPSGGLFPCHLMLGRIDSVSSVTPSVHRHAFLASPAKVGGSCAKELRQLFQRLVEMTVRFTNNPPLPAQSKSSETDEQIRLTPSRLGDSALSDRSIPYYYLQNGTPPLHHLWNFEKSCQNRANHNLSYRSGEYKEPSAPEFVTNALKHDLESHNFFRVEGHLGKKYQNVLRTILSLKSKYRLPIEVIALRTGAFDENISVDMSREGCRFQDLEALYDTLREELLSTLCEGIRYFYDVSMQQRSESTGGKPQLFLLKRYAPRYIYKENTVGAWYEKNITALQAIPYIDVDQDRIDANVALTVYRSLFTGTVGLLDQNLAHVVSIYYLSKLAEVLPDSLDSLSYNNFENKYQDLIELTRYLRSDAASKISDELKPFIPQEDLIDHFDQVLFSCKLEPIKSLHEEYKRRLNEIQKKQFLSFFLQKHLGVQHKAGVPAGGTFILVYHEDPKIKLLRPELLNEVRLRMAGEIKRDTAMSDVDAVAGIFERISKNIKLIEDPDIRSLFGTMTGKLPVSPRPPIAENPVMAIIKQVVDGLDDGTVIADFFLPYMCCSDCAPVQFVLPVPPLGLEVQLGCTAADGTAEATLIPKGGMEPITCQLDQQPFKQLDGKMPLSVGAHTVVIRDSAGAESAPQTFTVLGPLTIGEARYDENVPTQTYTVSFDISGGTLPYHSNVGKVSGSTYTSDPVKSGDSICVEITDNNRCRTTSKTFQHTVKPLCNLPCDGESIRCAYRLWIQPPVEEYYNYQHENGEIRFRFNRKDINLRDFDFFSHLSIDYLKKDNFQGIISDFIKKFNYYINEAIAKHFEEVYITDRLSISYDPNSEADPFGIIWIEYFSCETFSIEFDFSFTMSESQFILTMRYTNEDFNGAILTNRMMNNAKTLTPAFDCKIRNQCHEKKYEELCLKSISRPSINSPKRLDDNYKFLFTGSIEEDEEDVIAWIWDIPAMEMSEPFYEGKSVQVTKWKHPAGSLRLTVITKDGCFAFTTFEMPIN